MLKIMIIGSSRSVNTFRYLYQVFQDQQPEQNLVLGIMYYSGCSMSMHTNFTKQNAPVYRYYRNTDGKWETFENTRMEEGLKDQDWDVVLLQGGHGDYTQDMNLPCRTYLRDYVDRTVTNPHVFWWHGTWVNSTDPRLYADPAKAVGVDQYAQLKNTIEVAKKTVFQDGMFAGCITTGTPLVYALKVLNVPEMELYRDHTHLSDFGCLLVGYAWYAQFTGNAVAQINIDRIPASMRHTRYQSLGDLVMTEEMKKIILQSVQYTMENPWSVPGQP